MKSTKCPQCGLVYWNTAASCKRCGLPNADFEGERPATESQPEPAYQAQPQNNYYAPPPPRTSGADPLVWLWVKNLKSDAVLFYFIGGLQTLLWFFIGNLLIVDGALNIGLAFLAYKFRSRVAAICLCILTVLSVGAAILSFAFEGGFGLNPLSVIILIGRLLCSGRMIYSTFMLQKHAVEHFVSPPPPPTFQPDGSPQWATPAPSTNWQ
jgi:hypothetical protein